jgi:hypothetical protein
VGTVVTRHEFLGMLHDTLRPAAYVEIGVQHGWSLELAKGCPFTVGVDPDMSNITVDVGAAHLFAMTADGFFASPDAVMMPPVDMGFIDGMHLVEYAVRDFWHLEQCATPRTGVIVFDDVLPRNQAEAHRVQCPGDWTGDVWKITDVLGLLRPDLGLTLVDTEPTGCLMVTRLDPFSPTLIGRYDAITRIWAQDMTVPDRVLNRVGAVQAQEAVQVAKAAAGG